MAHLRVVIVGSLNMDLIVQLPRLPGPGETVAGDSLSQAPGGKGANQAVAAARLGASVALIGRVGRDAFGQALKRSLRAAGVSTRWVLASDRVTGAALIEVDESGENSIAVASGANADLLAEDIPPRIVQSADVVGAVLEVPMAAIEKAFRLARSARVPTVLNTAPAQVLPRELLRLSDVVICNEHELAVLLGRPVTRGDEAAAARALRAFPKQLVICTLGQRGALAIQADDVFAQPSFPATVVDTTGAGDAFVGGVLSSAWWSEGVPAALRLGCAAGALATTRSGAQPSMPDLAAVESLLARTADR